MPRRFYPRDDQLQPLSLLTTALEGFSEGRREKAAEEDYEEDRSFQGALRALEMDRLGLREGTAPTRPVAVEDSVFQDTGIGMARGAPGPSGLGLSLEATRRMGPKAFAPQPDMSEIVHPAGSFMRGVGFTEKALTRGDLVAIAQDRAARDAAIQVADPRYRQLNDDYYVDEEATPEGRASRSSAARQLQVLRSFRDLGASPQQLQLLQADPSFADEVYAQLNEEEDEPEAQRIRVGGRDFPDDETGQAAALAWQTSLREAGRDPDAAGDGTRITGEVTRRAAVSAAAREINRIREEARELARTGTPLEAGQVERQIRASISLFGFESVQEVEEEARELRTRGVEAAPGAEGVGEVTDDEIRRLMDEHPDLSDEEILELIERGES